MNLITRNSLIDDHFFDRFFSPTPREANPFFTPKINIEENTDHYLVTAEIPGVNKEDIHVHLENGNLILEAESKQENKEEKDGKIIRQERSYGKYLRSFNVGGDIKESDINANYDNGILSLKLTKTSEAEPTKKRINIR